MGFDLSAKQRGLGDKGYFRANIYQMILLRSAMLAAGVSPKLVYGKFVSNDGFLVTALQSEEIERRLLTWLKGKDLRLDLRERNENAKKVNKTYFQLFAELGDQETKATAKHWSRAKSLPVGLNANMRRGIREFALFCGRSSGFYVE